jgi:hypothetical protein
MSIEVLELIKPVVKNRSDLIPGVAYVIYACGCIMLQTEFNSQKRIHKHRNGKNKVVCPKHPEYENEYLGRYRICARCGKEEAVKKGRGFETNVCKECNASEWDLFLNESRKDPSMNRKELQESIRKDTPIKRKDRIKYYQNGKQIKKPKHPKTDPLCGNRDDCLDAAGYKGDTFIHCTGCPNWRNWIDL